MAAATAELAVQIGDQAYALRGDLVPADPLPALANCPGARLGGVVLVRIAIADQVLAAEAELIPAEEGKNLPGPILLP